MHSSPVERKRRGTRINKAVDKLGQATEKHRKTVLKLRQVVVNLVNNYPSTNGRYFVDYCKDVFPKLEKATDNVTENLKTFVANDGHV